MSSFISDRPPLALIFVLVCALAGPGFGQIGWEPSPNPRTEPQIRLPGPWPMVPLPEIDTWWLDEAPPAPLPPVWNTTAMPWPDLSSPRQSEYQSTLRLWQWQPITMPWRDIDPPRPLLQTALPQWQSFDHHRWRSTEMAVRYRERRLISYLDRRTNPYQDYLLDKAQQDLVNGAGWLAGAAITVLSPTPLGVGSLILSGLGNLTPPKSEVGDTLERGSQVLTGGNLVYEASLWPKGNFMISSGVAIGQWAASSWASTLVKDKYTSDETLYSLWREDNLNTRIEGASRIHMEKYFRPAVPRSRFGPSSIFDGEYRRTTTISTRYNERTGGGFSWTRDELDAVERDRQFVISGGGQGDEVTIIVSKPPPGPDEGGVDIDIELKEVEAEDTGTLEAALDARPSSDAVFWDFEVPEQEDDTVGDDEKAEKHNDKDGSP